MRSSVTIILRLLPKGSSLKTAATVPSKVEYNAQNIQFGSFGMVYPPKQNKDNKPLSNNENQEPSRKFGKTI